MHDAGFMVDLLDCHGFELSTYPLALMQLLNTSIQKEGVMSTFRFNSS